MKAAVLTVSDSCFKGTRIDESGEYIKRVLLENGWEVPFKEILPDEKKLIEDKLKEWVNRVDLILTTGGTGLSPRDVTPEATLEILEKRASGISEFIRWEGLKKTSRASLSRAEAGLKGSTLIVNLPGSLNAVKDGMEALFKILPHALEMMAGKGHE
ncbi:MAG: MogA/MoaB family molybdenum cofactor biosynthesis protein [Caldiserica bacterium]|jgi:molybdenum cofactor synthesis domain-containing protein|nr:MogA/MoaB family molybdenum cofactor biosynthesis protein [Caldisericota bacterium]